MRPVGKNSRLWRQYRIPRVMLEELREEEHVMLYSMPLRRRLLAAFEIVILGPRKVRRAKREGWRLSRLTDDAREAQDAIRDAEWWDLTPEADG
ncbi:MAG: hypothetical protein AAFQ43_00900 [Bacteroidota bacterium]